MNAQWFSVAELDDLKLPALRRDRAHLFRQAQDEGWQSRPRAGRGGGREYYIGSLPEAARFEIAKRALASDDSCSLAPVSETSHGSMASPFAGGILTAFSSACVPPGSAGGKAVSFAPATVAGKRASTRMTARHMIVTLCARFAEAGGLGQVIARQAFTAMFNAGEITVEPWVRTEVGKLTMRSVERWQSQVTREGIERLGGQYGHRKGQGQIDGNPELRDFCIAVMAARPKLTAKQLRDGVLARFGRDIPKRTIQRFMASARVEHAEAFMAAQNPDAWKNKYLVAHGSLSENVTCPNGRWEADASPADIMLLDPESENGQRRYHLIANIDVWSRRAKVLVTEVPKSTATLLVIRNCILDWGVPALQKTDNGKDFISAHCVRTFAGLKIPHIPCPPFTPEGKPHVERFFHTLQHDLIAMLPGFVGHNVTDRKAIEGQRSFANRLGEKDKLIEATLTAAELQQRIDDWLAHDYHRRSHEGLGTSPMLKMASWDGAIRRIEDERALDVLLAEAPDTHGTRVVSKKGLRVENALFIAPELALLVGDQVQVRLDPHDMGQIIVYALDGEFICVAKCPERGDIDRREVAMFGKQKQRDAQRDLRARMRAAKRVHRVGDLADEVAAMKREDAQRVVTFPRVEATETYSTPALDAAAEASRAMAGIAPAEIPLTDLDRELAAAAKAALPEAQVIAMPERKPEARDDAPTFVDDVEFYAFALAYPERLTTGQRDYFESVVRHDTSIQMRWSMRYGTSAKQQ